MSLENSKTIEALKRKSQQFEKLQRQSNEEKSRLREECLKSIQMIGELKSKITMLELKAQEQGDEVIIAKEKCAQAIARMTAIETELSSKTAKMEDLEEREQKWDSFFNCFSCQVYNKSFPRWRTQAYEITHEIKNRKEESFKREEKLILELNSKADTIKDQSRLILQHENSIQYLQSEINSLKSANNSMNQNVSMLIRKIGSWCLTPTFCSTDNRSEVWTRSAKAERGWTHRVTRKNRSRAEIHKSWSL